MRWIAGFVLVVTLILNPAGASATPTYPHVRDQARTLFETTREHLESESERIAAETGVEVFVIVERDLGGRSAREAALAVPIWDPSREQVLLLLSMKERIVRIEASPSIIARISDAEWARLIQIEMLPRLRRGRNGAAVRAGVDAIALKLSGQGRPMIAGGLAGDGRALRDMIFVLAAGLLATISFNGARHMRVRGGRW